ncbi:hypothetical protein [Bacillus cereus]
MNVQNAEENSKQTDTNAKTVASMRCAATIDATIVYIAENVKKITGKTKYKKTTIRYSFYCGFFLYYSFILN